MNHSSWKYKEYYVVYREVETFRKIGAIPQNRELMAKVREALSPDLMDLYDLKVIEDVSDVDIVENGLVSYGRRKLYQLKKQLHSILKQVYENSI